MQSQPHREHALWNKAPHPECFAPNPPQPQDTGLATTFPMRSKWRPGVLTKIKQVNAMVVESQCLLQAQVSAHALDD